MTTRDTVQGYFDALQRNAGWDSFLSDAMRFTGYTHPIMRHTGKSAYLDTTKRFYSMIKAMEVKRIIVEGDRACALTRYELQPPGGALFESHVAEVFEVQDGRITSFDIYFDSAPFPK